VSVLINKWRRLVPLFQLLSHHQGQDLDLYLDLDIDIDIDIGPDLDQDLELAPDPDLDTDPAQHQDLDLFLSIIASPRSFQSLRCGHTNRSAVSLRFQIQNL